MYEEQDAILKARDGDGDGFVYDGTPRMRPVRPGDSSSVLATLKRQLRNRGERGVVQGPKGKKAPAKKKSPAKKAPPKKSPAKKPAKKAPAKKAPSKKAPAKKAPSKAPAKKRQGGAKQVNRPPSRRKFMKRRMERALKRNPDGGAVKRALFDDGSGHRRTDKTFDMQLFEYPGFDQMTEDDRFKMAEWLAEHARREDIAGRREARDATEHDELEWDALVEDSKNWRKPLQPRDRSSKPGRLKDAVIRRAFRELGIIPGKKRKLSEQSIVNPGGERADDRDPTGKKVVGGVGDIPMTPGDRPERRGIAEGAEELGEARIAEHEERKKVERQIKRERQAAAKEERDKGAPNRGKLAAANVRSLQQREREEGIVRTGTEGITHPRTQSERDKERYRAGVEERRGVRLRAAHELKARGVNAIRSSKEWLEMIDAGEVDPIGREQMQAQARRQQWASPETRGAVDDALIDVRDSKNSELEVMLKRLREAIDAEEREIKANQAAAGKRDDGDGGRSALRPWFTEEGDYVYGDQVLNEKGEAVGERRPSHEAIEREASIVQANREKNKKKVIEELKEKKEQEIEEAVEAVVVGRDEAQRSFPRDSDGFIDYDQKWPDPFTETHQTVLEDEEKLQEAGVLPVEYLPEDYLKQLGLSRPDPTKADAVRAGSQRLDAYRRRREQRAELDRERKERRVARRRDRGMSIDDDDARWFMEREREHAEREREEAAEEAERIKNIMQMRDAQEGSSKSKKGKNGKEPKPAGFKGSDAEWDAMSHDQQLDWFFADDGDDVSKQLSEIISKRSVVRSLLRSLKARKFREDLIRRDWKGRFADKPGAGDDAPKKGRGERGAIKNPFNRSDKTPDEIEGKKAKRAAAKVEADKKKAKRKLKREMISTHVKDEFARGLKEGLERRNERGAVKTPQRRKKSKANSPKAKKPRTNKKSPDTDDQVDAPEAGRDRDERTPDGSRRERTEATLERERSAENVEAEDVASRGSRGREVDSADSVDDGADKAKSAEPDADESNPAADFVSSGGSWHAAPDLEALRGEDGPSYDEVEAWLHGSSQFKVLSSPSGTQNESLIVDTPRGKRILRRNAKDDLEEMKSESYVEALVSNVYGNLGVQSQFVTGIVGDSVLIEHLGERFPGIEDADTPKGTSEGIEDFQKHEWADRKEFVRLWLMDYLMGNMDRHSGNWMEYEDDDGRHIVAIDNGQSGVRGTQVGQIETIEDRDYENPSEIQSIDDDVDQIALAGQRSPETYVAEGWRPGKDKNNHQLNMLMRMGVLYDGDDEALQADIDEFLATLDPKTLATAFNEVPDNMPGYMDTEMGEMVVDSTYEIFIGRLEQLRAGGSKQVLGLSKQAAESWRRREVYHAQRDAALAQYPDDYKRMGK